MRSKRVLNIDNAGRIMIDAIIIFVIVFASISAFITIIVTGHDIYMLLAGLRDLDLTHLQDIANEIVFVFVFLEILRSALVARKRPEEYIAALGEVGFIITVRDVLRSSIIGSSRDIVLSAVGSAIFILIIYITRKYILPVRRSETYEREV
ncbi:hypothetical protein ACSU1N_02200 [Thermogladius sp. 4427co]|uniref:hypothetical protein n=1 Tax=Thermogladius sp. 4427co TaxID=3450718 RepID=UPI003F797BF4